MDRPGVADETVHDAAAENLVLHMTWAQTRVPGMVGRVSRHLALADAGLGTDTHSTICRARLDRTDREQIREAVQYFRSRRQPFSWWTGPGDTPAELPEMLAAEGLAPAESEVAMVADLDRLEPPPSLPDGLSIERVRSAEDLRTFAETIAGLSSPPDEAVVRFYRRAAPVLCAEDSPFRFYVGCVEGVPVATAEVARSGGGAGLYNVSTRAQYRRRGIGLAMTLEPLRSAREAGATLGFLQASEAGVGVYRRAGFRTFGEYREFKPGRPS